MKLENLGNSFRPDVMRGKTNSNIAAESGVEEVDNEARRIANIEALRNNRF